jgi:predicted O-methyltransferase YrrM
MDFEEVAAAIRGVPYMTESNGRRVYEHVRSSGATDVLELGTGHGVSTAYLAAAVGSGGLVTTVDHATARFEPSPAEVLSLAGLGDLVRIVRVEDSSYDWWLKDQVEGRSDDAGNCEPLYDFCYLDGAHNFTIDGLAVVLVEKLLRPGGWLLLDDLTWSYQHDFPEGQSTRELNLSKAELVTPHMSAVFELIVKQHPSFTQFRVEDEWGWAQKAAGKPRRLEIESKTSAQALVIRQLRRWKRALKSRVRGTS